jgi:hypothetical protein
MKFRIASLILLGSISTAYAAPKPVSKDYKKAQSEFMDACRESFRKSSTPTSEEVGKKICECATKDSKFEGAKASELREEAAEIRKDSKHEIKSEHIMNAFQWCTIEMMKKADRDSQRAS